MSEKLGLLFGSGVSCAVGYDGMGKVTERVENGDGVCRYPGGRIYYLNSGQGDSSCDWIFIIKKLLESLKRKTRKFYKELNREINYEDYYYIVKQIKDSLEGEYENPVAVPYEAYLSKWLKSQDQAAPELFKRLESVDYISPISFLDNACKYIEGIVICMLSKKPEHLERLRILREVHDDVKVGSLDIFTLNYDPVVEHLLTRWGIRYWDGFDVEDEGIRYYNPTLLDKYPSMNRLFKLHGSLDWFYFTDNQRIAIGVRDSDGHLIMSYGDQRRMSEPLILVGTFNKMLEYTKSIFNDMLCHFNRSMRYIDRIVISGYGFGDKGINSVLANWFSQDKRNRAVIIHHNPEKLRASARKAIGDPDRWYRLVNREQIKFCTEKIQEASWEEVKSLLFD